LGNAADKPTLQLRATLQVPEIPNFGRQKTKRIASNLIRSGYGSLLAAAGVVFTAAVPAVAQTQIDQTHTPTARQQGPPPWAFPVQLPGEPASDDGIPRHLIGSSATFSLTRIRDLFVVSDWYPDDHPLMPEVVARGRKPVLFACGYCHLPNGQGRPENAGLAGLPAAYIVQQLADYRGGRRRSSEPRMAPPGRMLAVAMAASEDEVKAAADYFSSLKFKPWIRVIESQTVPRTRVEDMLVPLEGGAMEPIGQRIIEVPEDVGRTELRDPRSAFIAYVPPGSIKEGELLVTTGAGKTIRCGICHGQNLKGLWTIPPIAGRSPSYIVRQLYDIQSGARAGFASPLMREVVANLTTGDMVSIAAYVASRAP
jgi:cytochrome c553